MNPQLSTALATIREADELERFEIHRSRTVGMVPNRRIFNKVNGSREKTYFDAFGYPQHLISCILFYPFLVCSRRDQTCSAPAPLNGGHSAPLEVTTR
jgi:hypothetical protein